MQIMLKTEILGKVLSGLAHRTTLGNLWRVSSMAEVAGDKAEIPKDTNERVFPKKCHFDWLVAGDDMLMIVNSKYK